MFLHGFPLGLFTIDASRILSLFSVSTPTEGTRLFPQFRGNAFLKMVAFLHTYWYEGMNGMYLWHILAFMSQRHFVKQIASGRAKENCIVPYNYLAYNAFIKSYAN